jgi:tetratricopeptide (TPR) repeat protein
VAAYREAVAAAPGHLEARVRLLRALYFQGEFATAAGAERAIFEGARSLGEETLDLLAARVGGREALDAMSAGERARALREVPEAPAVYFWSAVVWGLWGESVGRLKAARQGVGGRLRDYAETVIALDERYADAGGHRLLGRLHAVAPRIPFVTGWVDRQQALASLERAYSLAAEEPHNGLYLAEAILEHAPAQRGEAMEILRDLAARSPRPAKAVEDADVLARARQVLADQRAH